MCPLPSPMAFSSIGRKRLRAAIARIAPTFSKKCPTFPLSESFFGGRSDKVFYRETLEKGHVYRYKVRAYTDDGLTGAWSEIAEVSY